MSLFDASEALKTKILGDVATDYKERDRQINVLVRSQQAQEFKLADLRTVVVGRRGDLPVRLAAVADIHVEQGPARIQRMSQSRAAVVTATIAFDSQRTFLAKVWRNPAHRVRRWQRRLRCVPLCGDATSHCAAR